MNFLAIKGEKCYLNIPSNANINDDTVEKFCENYIAAERNGKKIRDMNTADEHYYNTCHVILIEDKGVDEATISCFIRKNRFFLYGISSSLNNSESISMYSFEIPEEVDSEKIVVSYIQNTFEIVLNYKKEFFRKKINIQHHEV